MGLNTTPHLRRVPSWHVCFWMVTTLILAVSSQANRHETHSTMSDKTKSESKAQGLQSTAASIAQQSETFNLKEGSPTPAILKTVSAVFNEAVQVTKLNPSLEDAVSGEHHVVNLSGLQHAETASLTLRLMSTVLVNRRGGAPFLWIINETLGASPLVAGS